jgi:hypothetical protein
MTLRGVGPDRGMSSLLRGLGLLAETHLIVGLHYLCTEKGRIISLHGNAAGKAALYANLFPLSISLRSFLRPDDKAQTNQTSGSMVHVEGVITSHRIKQPP